MLIRNLSNRIVNLQDSAGVIYTAQPYGDLTVSDSLWTDNEFRRNLRLRIREVEVESVTAGGASAPTDSPYVTTATVAGLSAEKVLGTEIIMKGTIGSRPAASINGRLYYVTDSGVQRLTRDTGSAWDDLLHGPTHGAGGIDALTGSFDINARVGVKRNSGSVVGTRRNLNFIEGSGVSITVSDDSGNEEVDITIGGGAQTGFISMYGSATPPTGWLLCDGSAVSRTTYAALFAIVSTGWGPGDGSTTFNLPDIRGRFPVGIGTNSDVNALGKSDAAAVGDRRPKHKHTVNDPGHYHVNSYSSPGGDPNIYGDVAPGASPVGSVNSGASLTGVTVGVQTNTPLDSGAYLVVPFIIKT